MVCLGFVLVCFGFFNGRIAMYELIEFDETGYGKTVCTGDWADIKGWLQLNGEWADFLDNSKGRWALVSHRQVRPKMAKMAG